MTGAFDGIDFPGDWVEQAACAGTDPDAFFVGKGGNVKPAKKVCRGCPVRAECLEFALENHEPFGIFGGLTENQRRRLIAQAINEDVAA